MKKWLSALLAAVLLLTASCGLRGTEMTAQADADPLKAAYDRAAQMMVEGNHSGAAEAFAALSGYSDAPQMAIYCRGLAFAAAGDYDTAVMAFTALGSYKDSAVRGAYYAAVSEQQKAEAAAASRTLVDMEAAMAHAEAAEAGFAALTYLPDVPGRLQACRALRADIARQLPAMRLARQCEEIRTGDAEHFIVKQGGKEGVLSVRGELVVPCQWKYIDWIQGGMVCVYEGATNRYGQPMESSFGVIDMQGNEILPLQYTEVYWLQDFLIAYVGDTVKYFSHTGEELTGMNAWSVAEGRNLAGKEDGWALVDADGRTLYEQSGTSLMNFFVNEDSLWVMVQREDETLVGLISTDGRELLPFVYSYADKGYFIDTQSMLLRDPDGMTAVYGADGQMLFEKRWEELCSAGDGFYAMIEDNLVGYVNLQGEVVIPCAYDCYYFSSENFVTSGRIVVTDPVQDKKGVLDTQGNVVLPCQYDNLVLNGGFILAANDEDEPVSLMNLQGEHLVYLPQEAEVSFAVTMGYFGVAVGGVLTIYDTQGRVVY